MCVFGDNFDYGGGNWKSNAIALSSDRDLTDGLYYSGMLMDGNAVKEIVVSRPKPGSIPMVRIRSDLHSYGRHCGRHPSVPELHECPRLDSYG